MGGFLKKIAAFLAAQKKRAATLAVGWLTDKASNWAFEYILYPIVIAQFGLIRGGAIMVILSISSSLAEIKLYDYLKRDWLGIEAVKEYRDGRAISFFGKVVQWAVRKGDVVALVALSLYSGPVKVTLYLRHGANRYNGFSRRDWAIFFTSVAISNSSWAIVVFGGVSLLKFFKEVIG